MLLLIELGLSLAAIALALCWPSLGSRWFDAVERKLAPLARHRKLAVLLVGLAALAARAAVIPILPVPPPRVDDEFSYLLAGDTFAHGRLANPTPAMWKHFETFHVIMRPTYQSKYPPAPSLVLAAGQVIAGHPFFGVWLSVGAMCAAICWMLQAWVRAEWALVGGLLAVMRFGVFSYWADGYWGGAVGAIGGALVLGALPRILESTKIRDALLMGLGLAILANTRPYEGLIVSLPVAAVLLAWLVKKRGAELLAAARRFVLPLAAVLVLMAAAMAFYFWRVTGNPLRMPYQVYEATYDPVPLFAWGTAGTVPEHLPAAMREAFLYYELPSYEAMRSALGSIRVYAERSEEAWLFYLGPALTLPLLLVVAIAPAGFTWRKLEWNTRFLFLTVVILVAGLSVEVYFLPHYAAPIAGVILALVILALRQVRGWSWRGRSAGLFLSRTVPLICLVMLALRAAAGPLHLFSSPRLPPTWFNADPRETPRQRILDHLNEIPGKQLVLVRYRTHPPIPHQWPQEWVFNGADIDSQKIIWAWDMGREENRELIAYYRGRRVWLVDHLDSSPPTLSAYPDR